MGSRYCDAEPRSAADKMLALLASLPLTAGVTLGKHLMSGGAEQRRNGSRQPAWCGPVNEPERRSKGGSLEVWRDDQGRERLLVLARTAAATGGGLRVNNRMQATAGPLVVTASAIRRRA